MRSLIFLASLTFLASTALADAPAAAPTPTAAPAPATPATNLVPLDFETIPEKCKPIAKQVSTATLTIALSGRVSLASCIADAKLKQLSLVDCQESVLALEDAMATSHELLDGVIVAGDPVLQVIAMHAKGELYTSMATRMRQTVPPPGTTDASIQLHDGRLRILESMLAAWRERATTAYERVVALVKATPRLEANPVITAALRTSRDRLATPVATR